MSTIREVLLSLDGEDATSIQPIIAFLEALGFNADGQAGAAFCLLTADQAPGLNVRQQLALKAAIQGAAAGPGAAGVIGASDQRIETAAKMFSEAAAKMLAELRSKLGLDVGSSSKSSGKSSSSSSDSSSSDSRTSSPDGGSDGAASSDGDEGLLEAAQDNFFAQASMWVLRQPEMYHDELGEDAPPVSFQPPTSEELMWNLAEVLVKAKLRADQQQ